MHKKGTIIQIQFDSKIMVQKQKQVESVELVEQIFGFLLLFLDKHFSAEQKDKGTPGYMLEIAHM